MEMLNIILIGFGLIVVAITGFLQYVYRYWQRKGFPYLKPSIPYGNLVTYQKQEQSFIVSAADLYNKSKEPFVGIYMFFQPALLVRDADLVKRILVDDFTSFYDRGIHSNEKTEPLSANIFNLEGKEWKNMRSKLSPTFTSGKLKNMFSTIENVGKSMEDYLAVTIPKGGKVIEVKALTIKYSMDIIASTFFGAEINSFKDNNHIFTKIRSDAISNGFLRNLASAGLFFAPKLYDWLQLYRVNKWVVATMTKIVEDTIDYREKTNTERKDFMQLLIQLRNTGTIKEDGDWSVQSDKKGTQAITNVQIAAQCFIFFIAGLETTADAVAFCLYELTQNEDVKRKLLVDINMTLEKHNGQITYDSIQDMKYLELVLLETLRKYPGLAILNRSCTKDYKIPGSNFTLEKGTKVIISLLGLQRDPEYFPDPLKFDPDRFSEENRNYNPNANLPFGDGPRACIGLRQGKLSAKVCLVRILTKYHIESSVKKELEFDNYAVGLVAKGGINVKLTKIEK